MKKLLIIIIITALISFVGCYSKSIAYEDIKVQKENSARIVYLRSKIETFNIDGCQYIGRLDGTEGDWLTHKGNCNNLRHKQDTIK